MGLAVVDFGVFFVAIVEDLQFGHAGIGWIASAWISNGQAVVASGWEFEFHTGDEIAVFCFGMENAALALFTGDGTVANFVVVGSAAPGVERCAVEERGKAFRIGFPTQQSLQDI